MIKTGNSHNHSWIHVWYWADIDMCLCIWSILNINSQKDPTHLTGWVCFCMLILRLILGRNRWEKQLTASTTSVILCCSYSMSLFSTDSFVFQGWKPCVKLLTGVKNFTIHIVQVSNPLTNTLTLNECRNNGVRDKKRQKVQTVTEFKNCFQSCFNMNYFCGVISKNFIIVIISYV